MMMKITKKSNKQLSEEVINKDKETKLLTRKERENMKMRKIILLMFLKLF